MLNAAALGALLVAVSSTLPSSAFAEATFESYGFAAVSVDGGEVFIPLGGAIDLDTSFLEAIEDATAVVEVDEVLVFDDFTLQDAGVSGSASGLPGADASAFAELLTSTSVAFVNTSDETAFLPYVIDYSANVFADADDLANEAVAASAQVLFGYFDFATGLEVFLVDELLELTEPGALEVLSALEGEIEVPAGGAVGVFTDVNVDGLALSTDPGDEEPPIVEPVPAISSAGLLITLAGMLGLGGFNARRR